MCRTSSFFKSSFIDNCVLNSYAFKAKYIPQEQKIYELCCCYFYELGMVEVPSL